MNKNTKNLIGKRFGRLIVLRDSGERKNRNVLWECKCDCGKITNGMGIHLTKGLKRSCGCLAKEILLKRITTHGLSNNKLYEVWINLKSRCENKKSTHYKNYGGRGIKVCDEWKHDFKLFYDWAILNGYKKGLDIDRINNDGDYSSDNCRFVTRKINMRNTRRNVYLTFFGVKKIIGDWAIYFGINNGTASSRYLRGVRGFGIFQNAKSEIGGRRFFLWDVSIFSKRCDGELLWWCNCLGCGKKKWVRQNHLKGLRSRNCGCSSILHGGSVIRCTRCMTYLQSLYRRDFVRCKCDRIFIDGGDAYDRIGFKEESDYEHVDE